mgnify:CR=1 FL=1
MSHDLSAFVVPDARLARAAGLDLEAAGLALAATPRHAAVLFVAYPLPDGLAAAAGVAYAQMPRPRSILATGTAAIPGLPDPDVVTRQDQDALRAGVADLRRRFAAGAFSPHAASFEFAAAATRTEYVCPMHPEVISDEPGRCPICGMDLVPRETAGATGHAAHHGDGAEGIAAAVHTGNSHEPGFTCPMHPEVVADAPGRCPICGMTLEPREAAPHPMLSPADDQPATYTCPMHPQIAQPVPGRCPICGMHLEPADPPLDRHGVEPIRAAAPHHGEHSPVSAPESSAGHGSAATGHAAHADGVGEGHEMDHGSMAHHASDHGGMTHPTPGNAAPPAARHEHAAMGHDAGDTAEQESHAVMDHGAAHSGMEAAATAAGVMDHSLHGGGFMSMVAMTRDLPRSADGLPMEWIDAPFGPLFPGLPGGLGVTLTLDGDGVAGAAATADSAERGLDATWPGPAASFPQRLERLDPLAPVAYRLLARRALEVVAGVEVDPEVCRARIREAERERVGSHLGWLAEFGFLIGDRWLAQQAAALQIGIARADGEIPDGLGRQIRRFVAGVPRVPLLGRRLAGIGETGADQNLMRGPVARAAGIVTDARQGDAAYAALGFAPVTGVGGDALARLQVRLGEIASSLDLIAAAGGVRGIADAPPLPAGVSGTSEAAIETPRGAARLHLVVEQGTVVMAHVDPPSSGHMALVPDITAGEEAADALVSIASLDLSPWEVAA